MCPSLALSQAIPYDTPLYLKKTSHLERGLPGEDNIKHIKQLKADIYCFKQRCLRDGMPLYDDECLLWSQQRLLQDQDEWLLHVSLLYRSGMLLAM